MVMSLVWPIVTYGSEAWSTNKELRKNVEALEIMLCFTEKCSAYHT